MEEPFLGCLLLLKVCVCVSLSLVIIFHAAWFFVRCIMVYIITEYGE